MSGTPSIAARLKSDTALAHAALEKEMLAHLRAVSGREAYARFLRLIHGFLAPLQARIETAFDASLLPDFPTRRSPRWIERDLAELPHAAAPTTAPPLPPIPSVAEAFGALYVLEGSTLGGGVIAGILRKSTGDPALPLRYFQSYGEDTRDRWKIFSEALIAFVEAQPQDSDRVVQAADDTFTAYRAWLQEADRPA